MSRPASPLLHDYKSSGRPGGGHSRALPWFIFGLGIPLLGLALVSVLRDAPEPAAQLPETVTALPAQAATTTVEPVVTGSSELKPVDAKVFSETPLVLMPEPEFDKLTLTIRRGDTLDKLFRKHDLNLGHLAEIARLEEAGQRFRRLKPGDTFEIEHDQGNLERMYSVLNLTSALEIERDENGFNAEIVERPIEIRKRLAYGVIESSLFESGAEAGLSDRLIMNVAGIFAWDIDFVFDIRTGDSYYIQYEEIWQNGEFVTDGEIIVAEFNNRGDSFQAIRFVDDEGRGEYFTPDGRSVRKALLRNPIDFTRISSRFNPNRRHPVLNTIRAHRGVDYAAPRGTPIKAAGDGKVIFRGTKGGYGRTVVLQHGGNVTTLYAHMSNFAAKAPLGARVRQGQTIGFVGATGLATGPHLHYEYRLNGVHRNPQTVDLPKADPIDAKYRDRFLASVEPILRELEQFKRTQLASVAYNET